MLVNSKMAPPLPQSYLCECYLSGNVLCVLCGICLLNQIKEQMKEIELHGRPLLGVSPLTALQMPPRKQLGDIQCYINSRPWQDRANNVLASWPLSVYIKSVKFFAYAILMQISASGTRPQCSSYQESGIGRLTRHQSHSAFVGRYRLKYFA